MRLQDIAVAIPGARTMGDPEADVRAVTHDSRQAGPGSLFVAIAGFRTDGHRYLREALQAGAAALLVQVDHEADWRDIEAPLIVVPDSRAALPLAAAALHGRPGRRLTVIGVTGTDGKTSLCHLIGHVLATPGSRAGLMTTATNRIGDRELADTGRFTTPEAPQVQALLAEMVEAGCAYAVLEATSHGLALHRLDGCEFDIAVMTNVGADHIDFHRSHDDYLAAKGLLFRMLNNSVPAVLPPDGGSSGPRTAVLNADDPASGYFRSLTSARAVTYALDAEADVRAEEIQADGWGVRFRLLTPAGEAEVRLARPGRFNVSNALAATAVALSLGFGLDDIVRRLESWPGAPGRMELVDEGQPFRVVVDFAHAPESIRRVLTELRAAGRGRLIAVFGCIGERDRERRFPMGKAAAELADYTYVTDDNPYSEDRDAILAEIARGLREAGKREGHDYAVVPDRREAIAQALAMAVDEDTVLLAGKGHERVVYLADGAYDCDDREVARGVLRELFPTRA